MVIKIFSDKRYAPLREINVKYINSEIVSTNIKQYKNIQSITLSDQDVPIALIKNDIWCDTGWLECLFSLDGVFYNCFSIERLPFAAEFPVCATSTEINLFEKKFWYVTSKSVKYWKLSILLQLLAFSILMAFIGFTLSIAFPEITLIISVCDILIILYYTISSINKYKYFMKFVIKD